MATKTYTSAGFSMTSTWTVNSSHKITSGPTSNSGSRKIEATDLPKGATITSKTISFTVSKPQNGGTITVGGAQRNAGSYSITVKGSATSYSLSGSFKSNGSTNLVGTFSNTVNVTNIKMVVTYTVSGSGGSGGSSQKDPVATTTPVNHGRYKGTDDFVSPPKACYIYDTDLNKYYYFDGVVKSSHALALKIEEEVQKNKEQYINNAKNEPNKLTMDVVMSDVYTDRSDLTDTQEVRSVSAFEVLNELKRSRRKVKVITTLMTYNEMLLGSISVEQNEDLQYGWAGQLTFQEPYESTQKKDSTASSVKDNGTTETRTPSCWYTTFGKIV